MNLISIPKSGRSARALAMNLTILAMICRPKAEMVVSLCLIDMTMV